LLQLRQIKSSGLRRKDGDRTKFVRCLFLAGLGLSVCHI
jgi:hypothetical protein